MSGKRTVDRRLTEVVSDVQMPLENLSYTVEAYLLANGARLDTETRFLLAGVRDCAERVADSARRLAVEAPAKSTAQSPGMLANNRTRRSI